MDWGWRVTDPYALRWDCSKRGCFNEIHRARVEILKDCLPGKISFGDLDGVVQIGKHGLILEFKGPGVDLGVGQRIMFDSFRIHNGLTTFVVGGEPRNLNVHRMMVFRSQGVIPWFEADLDALRSWVVRWVSWARSTP